MRMDVYSGGLFSSCERKENDWHVKTECFLRIFDSVLGEVARDVRSFSAPHRLHDWWIRTDDRHRTLTSPSENTVLERTDEDPPKIITFIDETDRHWTRSRAIVDVRVISMYWMSIVCDGLLMNRVDRRSTSTALECWAEGLMRREWSSQDFSRYSSLKSNTWTI